MNNGTDRKESDTQKNDMSAVEAEEKEERKNNGPSINPSAVAVRKEVFRPSQEFLGEDSPLLSKHKADEVVVKEARAVQLLLQHIADGEQNQAEILLKENPELLLRKGNVTDSSRRLFENITAFQYAVWALDWHMWTMLLHYMKPEDAAQQYQELTTQGTAHGMQASWEDLIKGYDDYLALEIAGSGKDGGKAWCEGVGKEQLLLPVHVVNEFCHPARPLSFLHHFRNAPEIKLPRKRIIEGFDWYDAGCGTEWAHHRWALAKPIHVNAANSVQVVNIGKDKLALTTLLEKRKQQAVDLALSLGMPTIASILRI